MHFSLCSRSIPSQSRSQHLSSIVIDHTLFITDYDAFFVIYFIIDFKLLRFCLLLILHVQHMCIFFFEL